MEGLSAHPLIKLQTLDVTNSEDVRRVVELIVAEAGQIDIVVNNGAFTSALTFRLSLLHTVAGVMGIGA
jgi:NAD(P)-dependent dehydrogenase (short-subunit alcohol dehydrogenase family)